MTLIELLVVIVILTTIVGAAIPLVSPSNDDRRLREATRTLNTYITGAQTRAIATNRPYGIALRRLSHNTKRAEDNGACLEVFYVEQPPAYTGFDSNSRACVALHPNITGAVLIRFVTRGMTTGDGLPPGWDSDLFPQGMIRAHDVIAINGTRYELVTDPNNSNNNRRYTDSSSVACETTTGLKFYQDPNRGNPVQIVGLPLNNSGQQINPRYDDAGYSLMADRGPAPPAPAKPPAPYWTLPAPYKVLRQPTPASDEPYQLPEGTAIDLRASGVGSGDYFYVQGIRDNDQDVLIMFAPEGRVARVSLSTLPTVTNGVDTFDQSVVDNLYLLVGRRENIGAPTVSSDLTLDGATWPPTPAKTEEELKKLREPLNWLGGGSRWIVIGSQSGRIATIENAYVDMAAIYNNYVSTMGAQSEGLRNQQIQAAREFTREMAQLSGR